MFDIDLVLQIPRLSKHDLSRYQLQAGNILRQYGLAAEAGNHAHVVKATHRGYDIDLILTGQVHIPGEWWSLAANTQSMLAWFNSCCNNCPQFSILCRALKLWR